MGHATGVIRMGELTSITVDEGFIASAAMLLNDLWDDVCERPDSYSSCSIEKCVRLVLVERPTQTWPYILMTQLLGKMTDERVNILSMHKSSELDGAWDARSLCEHVIARDGGFEATVLNGVLGGVKQPYNNSPAQKPELSRANKTAPKHVPIRDSVIDALSSVQSADEARQCLGYFLLVCREKLEAMLADEPVEGAREGVSLGLSRLRLFLRDLAGQGRDGEGLGVATALLLSLVLREEQGFSVVLHQSNSSGRGVAYRADLEVFHVSERYLAVELKDKPFSQAEVRDFARDARAAGFVRSSFVYGFGAGDVSGEMVPRQDLEDQVVTGSCAVCVGFTQLVDSLLVLAEDVSLEEVRSETVRLLDEARVKPRTVTVARSLLRDLIQREGEGQ